MTFVSCESQNKKTLSEYTCECINNISDELSGQALTDNLQKCFQSGYEKYPDEVKLIVGDFLNKNPGSDIASVQNNTTKVLVEKLLKTCSKYGKFTSDLINSQRTISNDVIKIVADEVCVEINKLKQEKLSNEIVDPIIMTLVTKYDEQISREYDFSDREQIQKFGYDLSFKLMADCEKYKLFGIQKQ